MIIITVVGIIIIIITTFHRMQMFVASLMKCV